MDEEDFKIKTRPKRKFPKLEKSAWELSLQDSMRYRILRDDEDFLLKRSLARDFKITEIIVGQILTVFVKEGLLKYKKVDPKVYPTISTSTIYRYRWTPSTLADYCQISWYENKWIYGSIPIFEHKGNLGYPSCLLRARPRLSQRQLEKNLHKNPPQTVDWDGKAYFIIRGPEFNKACKKLGIPSDPLSDWTCPECKKVTKYTELRCSGKNCKYQRLQFEWPFPKPTMKDCIKCGHKLSRDVPHDKTVCNMNVVHEVMEL